MHDDGPLDWQCLRLAAPPAATWLQIDTPAFVGRWLGLPVRQQAWCDGFAQASPTPTPTQRDAAADAGPDVAVPALRVVVRRPPQWLVVAVQAPDGPQTLTVRLRADGTGTAMEISLERGTPLQVDAEALVATDPIAWAQPPHGLVAGAPVLDLPAREAAANYLEGTARLFQHLAAQATEAIPPSAQRGAQAGMFSVAGHAWHLADLEVAGWWPRLRRAWHESRPQLRSFDGDAVAARRGYDRRAWQVGARRFAAARRRSLHCLARFDAPGLHRVVLFEGRGPITVGELVGAMVAHDREHRLDMAALLEPVARPSDRGV